MHSRSRTWGSGARAPAPTAGPQQRPEASQVHTPQALTSAYTLIKPNENRRNQIQRVAEQELEDLEKWKEQQRAKPINLVPRRLGGSQSEAEVRQKQQFQLMQSKYQQKLKREESIRIKKEAEEAEIQKMKAIQREKGNRLEEKKRLREKLRREEFRVHQQYVTSDVFSKPNTDSPSKNAHQFAPCEPAPSSWKLPALSSDHNRQSRNRSYWDSLKEEENRRFQKMKEEQRQKSELLKFKQEQQEEQRIRTHQSEQKRVNNAFLDRLQGKSQPGGLEHFGGYWNMNSGNSWGS